MPIRFGLHRLSRLIAAAGLVLAISAVPAAHAAACSCAQMVPAEALAASDAAFSGTVVAASEAAVPADRGLPFGPGGVRYAFDVDGVAKGDVPASVEVLAGGDSAGCGMTFGTGERWLVFATAEGGSLSTHLCAGNVPLAAGDEPPVSVATPEDIDAEEAGLAVPVGVIVPAGALLALAAVSGFLFWRADRAS